MMTQTLKNWAGNLDFSTSNIHYPEAIGDAQAIVHACDKLRIIGTRHSFNTIADSPHNLVSLQNLARIIHLDSEKQVVTTEGGISYGALSQFLVEKGYALHNLASLPHISVAGACATATHGSGDKNGNLATSVRQMEIITANGELMTISQADEIFGGSVVGLGGLGIVAKITLEISPAYQMQQYVYLGLPVSQVEDQFDAIMSSAYSVSLFTLWQGDMVDQVFLKRRVMDMPLDKAPPEFFGAKLATENCHPIPGVSAIHCTEQMGVLGDWHERLPHFRMEFTPSHGEELQSEYFVPRESAVAAFKALRQIQDHIAPHLFVSEVRSIAADELWMSPCYHQDSVAFHFTWKPDWVSVQKVLPLIENQLAPFGARPHWGKLFTMPPAKLRSLYPKLADFQKLLQTVDVNGKFRNPFLDTYIFGVD